MIVSRFNTLPERQRAEYDAEALSKDLRNLCLFLAAVMAAGCVLSCFVLLHMSVAAYVAFVALVLKDVRFSADDAFEKYRKRGRFHVGVLCKRHRRAVHDLSANCGIATAKACCKCTE